MDKNLLRPLSNNPAQPLYLQIREALSDSIDYADLKADDPLPSERDMSEFYSVNRLTVRKALEEMIRDGSIYQVPGKGTFVSRPKLDQKLLVMTSFTEAIRNEGHTPGSRLLGFCRVTPRPSILRAMGLPKEECVLKIRRLRSIDDEPFSISTSFLPLKYGEKLDADDFSDRSLYDILRERCGLVMSKTHSTLEAVSADAAAAEILGISTGIPMFLMSGTTSSQTGEVVEFFKVLYRGDRLRFSTESA